MGVLLDLIRIAFVLFALYCFLVAPNLVRRKLCNRQLTNWDYAHRGLHDKKIPENSLTAFEKAVQAGYGIELDVRVTRDNMLVVHHDETLERSCGDNRRVRDVALDDLQKLCLFESQEYIPTFDEVLALIDGRVPLIIELKTDFSNKALAAQVYERLKRYKGVYCVESFDPFAMRWFKKHAPQVVRGQLAFMPSLSGKPFVEKLRRLALGYLLVNFLSRPDFVAYGYKSDKNLSFRFVANVFRPLLATWTVESESVYQELQKYYDIQIFERFRAPRRSV